MEVLGPALVEAVASVLTVEALIAMVVGVAIGYFVGIIPGLGGPIALAIMIPFTFGMDPVPAFALLLGMVATTPTTGGITSILFGIPGEAVAAALIVDGHPMAKQGMAGRALGASLGASLVGALIGATILALSIPFVRPIVLLFASPELFMLVLLGITFLGALSARSPLRGLLAGGLGLLCSMMGTSLQTSIPRYTFGYTPLWDGITLVAAAIGLFAIPELVDLATRRTSISDKGLSKRIGGVAAGLREVFHHRWLVLRCSLIGTFVGMLPGLGGSVAQWIAYGHAAQTSDHPERFGSGAVEGVIGPGAANDSKDGGSLIPTLAFGIPGGLNMAILLGAFLIHGLTPGPSMLTTNLHVTMAFVIILVVSNILAVLLALRTATLLIKLTVIRWGLIFGPTVVLTIVGTFAARNSMPDVVIMLLIGLLGIWMQRAGWPRAPLLLGLVLGQLGENYLWISTSRFGLAWLTRPIVLVLLAICVLAVVVPILHERRRARVSTGQPPGGAPSA